MSAEAWYYARSGSDKRSGPVTTAQLRGLATSGEVVSTDLIWKEGMAAWMPAGRAKGLFPQQAGPPPLPSGNASPPPLPAGPAVAKAEGRGPTCPAEERVARRLGAGDRLAALPARAKVAIGVGAGVLVLVVAASLLGKAKRPEAGRAEPANGASASSKLTLRPSVLRISRTHAGSCVSPAGPGCVPA